MGKTWDEIKAERAAKNIVAIDKNKSIVRAGNSIQTPDKTWYSVKAERAGKPTPVVDTRNINDNIRKTLSQFVPAQNTQTKPVEVSPAVKRSVSQGVSKSMDEFNPSAINTTYKDNKRNERTEAANTNHSNAILEFKKLHPEYVDSKKMPGMESATGYKSYDTIAAEYNHAKNTKRDHGISGGTELRPLTELEKQNKLLSDAGAKLKLATIGVAKGLGSDALTRVTNAALMHSAKNDYTRQALASQKAAYDDVGLMNDMMGRSTSAEFSKVDKFTLGAGEVAGGIAQLVGIGYLTGGTAAALGLSHKAAALTASALTGFTSGAIGEYGAGGDAEDVLTKAVASSAFFLAGGAASQKAGIALVKKLTPIYQQNPQWGAVLKAVQSAGEGATMGVVGTAASAGVGAAMGDELPTIDEVIKSGLTLAGYQVAMSMLMRKPFQPYQSVGQQNSSERGGSYTQFDKTLSASELKKRGYVEIKKTGVWQNPKDPSDTLAEMINIEGVGVYKRDIWAAERSLGRKLTNAEIKRSAQDPNYFDTLRASKNPGFNENANTSATGNTSVKPTQNQTTGVLGVSGPVQANEPVKYNPKEPKQPVQKQPLKGDYPVGTQLETTKYGPITVIDASDSAFLWIRQQSGIEVPIGRKALSDILVQGPVTETKVADVQERQSIEQPIKVAVEPVTTSKNTYEVYQGRGKTRDEIYTGTKHPVLGDAQYYALNEDNAKKYGDDVSKSSVSLENPVVIQDDLDWKRLTTKAGWKFAKLTPGLEGNVELIESLKKAIIDAGHDGVVIKYEDLVNGDENRLTNNSIKILQDMFGHDQIVSYQQTELASTEKKQAASPVNENDSYVDGESETDDEPSLKSFKNGELKKKKFDTADMRVVEHQGKKFYVAKEYKTKNNSNLFLVPIEKADDLHDLVDKDTGAKLQEWMYDSEGKSVGYWTHDKDVQNASESISKTAEKQAVNKKPEKDHYTGIDSEKAEIYKKIYTAKAYEKTTPAPTKIVPKDSMLVTSETYLSNGHWLLKKNMVKPSLMKQLEKLDRKREMTDAEIKKNFLNVDKGVGEEINFEFIGFNDVYSVLKDPKSGKVITVNKNYFDYLNGLGLKFKQFDKVEITAPIGLYQNDELVGIVLPVRAKEVAGINAADIVNLDSNYPPVKEANSKNSPDLTGFKNKEYTIKTSDGDKIVKGLVIGDYGFDSKTNAISHIQSGRQVSFANNQTHGKMIMKYLDLYMGSVDPDNLTTDQKKVLEDIKDFSYRDIDALLEGKGHSMTADKVRTFIDATQKTKPDGYVPWGPENSIRNQYTWGPGQKIKPVHEIMADIRKSFKVGISNTRFKSRKAYAHYKAFPQVIESKIVNTIEPLMHELGHHFDYRYKLNQSPFIKEMISKMPADFLVNYPDKSTHKKEAVAEFMRLYMTSPDDAMEFSNGFYEQFENSLSPADLKSIQRIRGDVLRWLDASIQDQIKSTRVSRLSRKPVAVIASEIKDNFEMARKKAYMFLFNELQPLDDFAKYIEKTTGVKLSTKNNPYELALYSLKSTTRARAIAVDNMVDPNGKVIGVPFKTIMDGITVKNYEEFNNYLIAKRALDYHARGKRTFSDDIPISFVESTVANYESSMPELKVAADKLYAWWTRFTEAWVVETGLMDSALYEHMQELEPHYVPFFRQRQEDVMIGDVIRQLARRGYVDHRSPLKRSSKDGSSDPIYNPVESMLAEIERYVTTVDRRHVMLAVHESYMELMKKKDTSSGIGTIMNKVAARMDVNQVNMKDKKNELAMTLYDEFAKTLTVDERLEFETLKKDAIEQRIPFDAMLNYLHEKGFNAMSIVNEIIDDTVLEFKAMDLDKEANIVTIKDREGKTHHYEIFDRFLLEALLNNDISNLDTATRIVSSIRRSVQAVTTSFNPIFIAKNLSRDTGTGFSFSNIPMHEYHVRLVSAIGQQLTSGEWAVKYRGAGGGFSGQIGADRNALEQTIADIVPGWEKNHPLKAILHGMERFSDALEQAPRLAEFTHSLEKNGDDISSIIEAMNRASDVTVNFNRKGQIMRRWYGNVIPFFNPALQGIDKTVRMHSKEKAPKTITRALIGITIGTLVLYAINREDEEYKKLSGFIKDGNYLFYQGTPGQYIRVPKPQGIGMIYGASFERLIESAIEKTPDAWEGFLKNLVDAFMPPVEPITKGYTDAKNNKTWYDGEIVPYAYQRLQKDQQFDDKTSYFAKQIAKLIPDGSNLSSPMIIDYVIGQYTGIIGKVAIPMTDDVKGNGFEFAIRSFTTDVAYSNNVVPKFYDRLKSMESVIDTVKFGRMPKNPKQVAAYPMYKETNEAIKELRALHDQLDKMDADTYAAITKDVSISKEKFKRLLKLEILKMAEQANKTYDSYVK